jgi:Fanconi anemia group M protein
LGLTASPGNDSKRIKKICSNLYIEEVELRTRDSLDVKEYLQERKFEKIILTLIPQIEEIRQALRQLFDQYIGDLKRRRVLYTIPSKTELIKLQNRLARSITGQDFNSMIALSSCAQSIKLQHALELLETQTLTSFNLYLEKLVEEARNQKSKGVVKLVNKPEFQFALTRTKELLKKGIEHPKLEKIIEIVEKEKKEKLRIIIFTQYRETAKKISDEVSNIRGIKSKVFVGQAKKGNTGLSQKEQSKIIQEFSEGKINILCATSIAEEGLDIPEVHAVIFYEPIPSAIRAIQRAGRTARLMKGKLIILITKGTRDESFYYISRSREKKMHSAIKEIKEGFSKNKKREFQKKLL